MSASRLLGSFGEALCAEMLRKMGYKVLAMNYRTRLGEIDLIAADKKYVAFVEVKLRRDDTFAQAREYVTRAKQQRIIASAQEWLQRNPTSLQPRFDVAEIYAPQGTDTKEPEFRYWKDAFSAD